MTAMVLLSEWMASQVEFWKPIEGFVGYDVSSNGRVRSWWKRGAGGQWNKRDVSSVSCLIVRLTEHRQGYLEATLYRKSDKRSIQKVHRLVAIAFIDNPGNEPTVNHRTGLKSDNRINNLEWKSRSEQVEHAFKIGLMKGYRGVYRPRIAESIRIEARRMAMEGVPQTIIARTLAVSRPTVARVRVTLMRRQRF